MWGLLHMNSLEGWAGPNLPCHLRLMYFLQHEHVKFKQSKGPQGHASTSATTAFLQVWCVGHQETIPVGYCDFDNHRHLGARACAQVLFLVSFQNVVQPPP